MISQSSVANDNTVETDAQHAAQSDASWPSTPGPMDQYESHIFDYFRILYKRRWSAMTVALIVAGVGIVSSYTTVPIYEGRAQLLIEIDSPNIVNFKPVIDQENFTYYFYPTQYRILQSRSLTKRTLDNLQLWTHPEFTTTTHQSLSVVARRAVRSGVSRALALIRPPSAATAAAPTPDANTTGESSAQTRVINAFLGSVIIAPVKDSRLVEIRFRATDPSLAATAANGLARAYIEQNLEFKFEASREASDWLGKRIAEHRQRVEASELALQTYREMSDAVALEDRQNIVVQKLADLNGAVTRAKTDRIGKEAILAQMNALQGDLRRIDSLPSILGNSYIQQLKTDLTAVQRQLAQLSEKLGDQHPDIVKLRSTVQITQGKLEAEIANVVQSIRNEYEATKAQEDSLIEALESQKQEALALNRKEIGYAALQREADSNRQIYNNLLQRAKETGVSEELKTSNVRVIDSAQVPSSPVHPNKSRDSMLAILMGLGAGILVAFGFEYLDNRIKSPQEIKTNLGLPCFGMLPAVRRKQATTGDLLISTAIPPNFAEAFRAVRTNVLYSSSEPGAKSLLITSTGAGEGKTVVASNLAIALAQTGKRVVIIDADMRRPRLHQVFDVAQEPGLSNLIVGNAKAAEAIIRTSVPQLWLVAAGHLPPNPADLLESKRFKDFVDALSEQFDWILIDSPPVIPVTDPAIIARIAHSVLFVIGAEMVSRQAARHALEQLGARSQHVGAVLNKVDLDKNSYYYSTYYNSQYRDYYVVPSPG